MGVHDFDDPLLRKNNWLREAFVPSVQGDSPEPCPGERTSSIEQLCS
jgi:hypothetical protein